MLTYHFRIDFHEFGIRIKGSAVGLAFEVGVRVVSSQITVEAL